MPLHLTNEPDPFIDRCLGIGGSDAKAILDTDWTYLWMEKTRRVAGPDLSNKLNVQLGIYTERFNANWFTNLTGMEVIQPHPYYTHPSHDFMYAHLDGVIEGTNEPFEAKHTNDRNDLNGLMHWYLPQIQHYMAITGHDRLWFSVIYGNNRHSHHEIERNQDYIDNLIELEAAFWWHVTNDIRPEGNQKVEETKAIVTASAPDTVIDGMITADMTGNNEWATLAIDLIASADAHVTYDKANKAIRTLVPANAREASGHGVSLTRNKAGSLRIKLGEAA